MPTPRNSLAKARLTGADKNHPERYRDRTEPVTSGDPVGRAPDYLSDNAKAVWIELSASLGWLQKEDRAALELTAAATGQIRDLVTVGAPVPSSLISAANAALGKLGGTPADRQRVMVPSAGPESNPFDQFH